MLDIKVLISAVGGFVLGQLLRLPSALVEDAVTGWINQQIASELGLASPEAASVVEFITTWVLPTVAGFLIIWACIKIALWRNPKSSSSTLPAVKIDYGDPAILQIRTDVMRLTETCSGYGNPSAEREDVLERRARIQNSDHPIWLNPDIAQARRDFLHWIGIAQEDRERYGPTFETKEARNEVVAYIKDARRRLEAGLIGAEIPDELMPLPEAASIAFDQLRSTDNQETRITFDVLSRLENDEQDKLPGLVCQVLFNNTDIELYGVLPPGKKMCKIPKEDRDSYMFSNDASELFDQFNTSKRYKELSVRRADFERRLEEIT